MSPNTELTVELLTKPLILFGFRLVIVSVVVVGFALQDGDAATALGMGLLFALGAPMTGISLSDKLI